GSAPGLQRLVMLAPANFGSPLAHVGQSMLGRIVKGWRNWFSTGKRMLEYLELASPYQRQLVCRDLLVDPADSDTWTPYKKKGGVWPFVLTGSHPYTDSVRKVLNENGGDGTVRAASANMNVYGYTLDFTRDVEIPEYSVWESRL